MSDGYQVDTAYLRGYASQLGGNCSGGMTAIADYANVHCRNFDRISGLLEPAEWLSDWVAGRFTDRIFPKVHDLIQTTSDRLATTATTYDTAEQHAVLQFRIDHGGEAGTEQPGGTSEAPAGQPTAIGFTDGADVAPKPPRDEKKTDWVEDKLADLFGEVSSVVKFFTGYDIIAEWAPVVLGDWGALDRLAEAYGEITHSLRAVHQDLTAGLAVLAPYWLASSDGGSAGGFYKHMQDRVLGYLDVSVEAADMTRAAHEYWSKTYEALVTNAFWLLDFYAVRFKSIVKRITKAAKDFSFLNPSTWIDLIEELWGIVEDFIEFVKTTIHAIEVCVEQYRELAELAIQEIDFWISKISYDLKNLGEEDYGPASPE